jgi:hypothetical protein
MPSGCSTDRAAPGSDAGRTIDSGFIPVAEDRARAEKVEKGRERSARTAPKQRESVRHHKPERTGSAGSPVGRGPRTTGNRHREGDEAPARPEDRPELSGGPPSRNADLPRRLHRFRPVPNRHLPNRRTPAPGPHAHWHTHDRNAEGVPAGSAPIARTTLPPSRQAPKAIRLHVHIGAWVECTVR